MALLDPRERSDRGQRIQAEVIGAPAPAPDSLMAESWRDFIFAEIWSRPGMDRRARYLVALAGAVIAGASTRAEEYLRGALTAGALSLAELREAALHLGVYAGWSRGDALDAAISRVAAMLDLAPADSPAIRLEAWDAAMRSEQGGQQFMEVMTFPGGPPATPYLEAIRNFVFGEMWCRPGLDQRARRWITLVGVCESGADVPIRSHVHSAMTSGNCTPDQMQEFVLQYGVHAGWPKASVIQGVVSEMSKKVAAGLPWNG